MKRLGGILITLLFLSNASSLQSQSSPATPGRDLAVETLYNPNADVGDAQGAVLDDGSGIVVSVNDKTQKAAIQFVWPWKKSKLSLTVTAAVDEDTGTAEFAGFNSPLGAQQVKLEYNYVRWPEFSLYEVFAESKLDARSSSSDLLDQLLRKEISVCRDAIAFIKERLDAGLRQTLWSAELESVYQAVEKAEPPSEEEIERYIKNTTQGGAPNLPETEEEKRAEAKVQALIQSVDQDKGVCAQLEKLYPRLYSTRVLVRGELTDRRAVILYGLNGAVGRKKFSFLDRELLDTEGSVDTESDFESPASFGLRLGWIFLTPELEGTPESSLILSYNRERNFEEAGKLTFCQPADGFEDTPAAEICKEIPGTEPSSTDSNLFSVEYRKKFKKVGVAIRGFYRGIKGKADDFGLEVPLYFLRNTDGGFQGGVTFGWRDQEDDGFLAVFVGRKFEIF